MISDSVKKLADIFLKFPGIGPRQSLRFAFHLLKSPKTDLEEIIQSLTDLKEKAIKCPNCLLIHEKISDSPNNQCYICKDQDRQNNVICLIEKEADMIAIEETRKYNGTYHILGTTNLFNKNTENKENISALKERIKKIKTKKNDVEIIFALDNKRNNNFVSLYIEKELMPYGVKITRLGRGLPTGGEIEYADPETLSNALLGRK